MNFRYLRILKAQHWAYVTNGKHRLCLYQTPVCVFAFDADTDETVGKVYNNLKFFYILNELKKIGYNHIIYKEKANEY